MDIVRLAVSFVDGRATSGKYRATNVGFGITYAFPIIVAALASRPNALLIIENPEVHLHPRAQTAIAQLLCLAVKGGAQVLVESHSDHVLNGIRLAVKTGILEPGAVAVHFFTRAIVEDRFVHTAVSPEIDAHGRIDKWPEGFFDEYERALEDLI
jgi:predicted ATPase